MLSVRVHDALIVCQCGVRGAFSGDVERLQGKHCYRCQARGRFVGTILQGYFRNMVFWDYRDAMAFAWFAFLYSERTNWLRQSRRDRAADFQERIHRGEAGIRSRLLMMNALSTLITTDVVARRETVETAKLGRDLSTAAELLAESMCDVLRDRHQWRYLDLSEVLFDADAVKWFDVSAQAWTTGTLVEIRKPLVTVIAGDVTYIRFILPFMSVLRADADE